MGIEIQAADDLTATGVETAILLVSFELSQSRWVLTIRAAGGAKLSRFTVPARDTEKALSLLTTQRQQAERRTGRPVRIVSIYEAGLDGFWLHHWLEGQGIESHVVDPASILGPQRNRSKTLIELAWSWQRHQAASALTQWFHKRANGQSKRVRRIAIPGSAPGADAVRRHRQGCRRGTAGQCWRRSYSAACVPSITVACADSTPPLPCTSAVSACATCRASHSPRNCRTASISRNSPYMPGWQVPTIRRHWCSPAGCPSARYVRR